ncbi:hypothetical protein BASA50_002197 [Batrachochytrium salamandrivorans]|uniref:Large ribosomal subunit protein uL6 alpha-beta domain-containing protein n=1 Tax=Batrachochytrium salamandrivorans TaxID=1357716 RepID=A0ABQ8FM62_9FUNG|nr:hypothetical protein BASA60_005750 [Batrachochytrium salamandrivorans]KAH6600630.1 hypothetical protein BASA50_002197 [Batrachochytrium salamandrivorans]KAH9272245.1 hypothetical protein BASA83_005587 [Batrachochytrium salamandrivorans]
MLLSRRRLLPLPTGLLHFPFRAGFHSTAITASKLGAKPIKCPAEVTVQIDPYRPTPSFPDCITKVTIKGPKGQLSMPVKPFVTLTLPAPVLPADAATTTTITQAIQTAPAGSTSTPTNPSNGMPLDDDSLYDNLKNKGISRTISVSIASQLDKKQKAMWGTTRALINNMITGVTEGYMVPIRLVGVGYRAQVDSIPAADASPLDPSNQKQLVVRLGFPNPLIFPIPVGIDVSVPAPQRIILQGIDRHLLTSFAANVRKWRKPEPYNQKGVFVGDETIKKKDGKKR